MLRILAFLFASLLGLVGSATARSSRPTVSLGYFPNVTHAPALVGVQRGDFARALEPEARLRVVSFNAGPSVIEAIYAGHLDLAYIGPSPTLNGYFRSNGNEVRVIAGAVTNGVVIVGNARRGISTWEQLRGGRVATPQLANTQDIAAKFFFGVTKGWGVGEGPGQVRVIPVANPDIEILFEKDQLEGAWIPEPWAARMIDKGLVVRIAEEKELWPAGEFALTGVIARRAFLEQHPELVRRFLVAHAAIVEELAADPTALGETINAEITRLTGKPLPEGVLRASLASCGFSLDPDMETFKGYLDMGRQLGFLPAEGAPLEGLFATGLLEEVLGRQSTVRPGATGAASAAATKAPADRAGVAIGLVLGALVLGAVLVVERISRVTLGDRPRWAATTVRVLFPLGAVALWHAVAALGVVPAYLLPTPLTVVQSGWHLATSGALAASIGSSMSRMLIGYGISAALGLVIGVLIAQSWLAKHTLGALALAIQSLPSICWLPFALLWVGLNEKAILAVIILGALFSIAVSTDNAIRNVPPIYRRVGRTLGAGQLTLAKDVLFFAALPELIGGLKVGWTFAWRSLMAAELIRSDVTGIGHLLEVGRQFNDMGQMIAAVTTILAIGVAVDLLVFGRAEAAVRRRFGLERH
jgi:NitT/TauT family transport system substrate-binding protein